MKAQLPTKGKALSTAKCYKVVGEWNRMKPKQVKAAVEGVLAFAADQRNKNGSFNVADMLILKLKVKPELKRFRWNGSGLHR